MSIGHLHFLFGKRSHSFFLIIHDRLQKSGHFLAQGASFDAFFSIAVKQLAFSSPLDRRVLTQNQSSNNPLESESESCSVVSNSLQPHGLQSVEFSRPEYWNGQPFPSAGNLSNPGAEPKSPTLQADSLQLSHKGSQEHWSGQPIPSPGDFPDPGTEPGSPAWLVVSLPTDLLGKP